MRLIPEKTDETTRRLIDYNRKTKSPAKKTEEHIGGGLVVLGDEKLEAKKEGRNQRSLMLFFFVLSIAYVDLVPLILMTPTKKRSDG